MHSFDEWKTRMMRCGVKEGEYIEGQSHLFIKKNINSFSRSI